MRWGLLVYTRLKVGWVKGFEHVSFQYYLEVESIGSVLWRVHLFALVVIMFPLGDLSRYGQKKEWKKYFCCRLDKLFHRASNFLNTGFNLNSYKIYQNAHHITTNGPYQIFDDSLELRDYTKKLSLGF